MPAWLYDTLYAATRFTNANHLPIGLHRHTAQLPTTTRQPTAYYTTTDRAATRQPRQPTAYYTTTRLTDALKLPAASHGYIPKLPTATRITDVLKLPGTLHRHSTKLPTTARQPTRCPISKQSARYSPRSATTPAANL